MHKLAAIHKSVKGRPVWEVNVPLSVCGKRVRLSRLTEREALAAAPTSKTEITYSGASVQSDGQWTAHPPETIQARPVGLKSFFPLVAQP